MNSKRILTVIILASISINTFATSQEHPSIFDSTNTNPWSGFYAGINLGGGFGNGSANESGHSSNLDFAYNNGNGNIPSNYNITSNGVLGGGQIGYNLLIKKIILGFETDFQGSGISGNKNIYIPSTSDLCESSNNAKNDLNYFGTSRLRLGFNPVDSVMLYATGGFAYGNTSTSSKTAWNSGGSSCDGPLSGSSNTTAVGWTTGLGAEYFFIQKWSLKAEYLYVDLGKTKYTANVPTNDASMDYQFDQQYNIFRLGLNYKF